MMDELTPTHAFKTDKQLLEEARAAIDELVGALNGFFDEFGDFEFDTKTIADAKSAIAKHSTKGAIKHGA